MFSTQGNAIRTQNEIDTICLQMCDEGCGIGGGATNFRTSEVRRAVKNMLVSSWAAGKYQVGEVKFVDKGLVGNNYITEITMKLQNILM